jgi:hypothetical protein
MNQHNHKENAQAKKCKISKIFFFSRSKSKKINQIKILCKKIRIPVFTLMLMESASVDLASGTAYHFPDTTKLPCT